MTGALTMLLLALLLVVPGAAFWTLVGGLDPVGRLVAAAAAAIVTVAATAQVMLMLGAWSPRAGLVAVLVLSALAAMAGLLSRRPRPPGRPPAVQAPPPPAARPAEATRRDLPLPRRDADEDDWIYRD